jgi:hypothetical protein
MWKDRRISKNMAVFNVHEDKEIRPERESGFSKHWHRWLSEARTVKFSRITLQKSTIELIDQKSPEIETGV